MNIFDELDMCLERLRKNNEVLTKEEIETKYKKAYESLVKRTYGLIKEIILGSLGTARTMKDEEGEEIGKKIRSVFEDYVLAGENARKIWQITIASYDFDIIFTLADYLAGYKVYKIYYPYFMNHCYVPKEGCRGHVFSYEPEIECRYYNEIVRAWYLEKENFSSWMCEEDGKPGFLFAPSPYPEEAYAERTRDLELDKEILDKFWEKYNKEHSMTEYDVSQMITF